VIFAAIDFPNFPKANCIGFGDFFFPVKEVELQERLPRLQELCGTCEHQAQCLDYSIENEIPDGFWAGLSADERKAKFSSKENNQRRNRQLEEIKHLQTQGLSIQEISQILKVQVASIERTLSRAKRKGLAL
jgi:hypothetical protein